MKEMKEENQDNFIILYQSTLARVCHSVHNYYIKFCIRIFSNTRSATLVYVLHLPLPQISPYCQLFDI